MESRSQFLNCADSCCFTGAASAERLAVAVSVANIRSGPGENHEILWEVEKYYPIDVFKKSGQWYHFRDFEGDEGWIHKSLLGKIPSVITKKDDCNIRSGPGPSFAIVFTVEKGIPFKEIKRKKAGFTFSMPTETRGGSIITGMVRSDGLSGLFYGELSR